MVPLRAVRLGNAPSTCAAKRWPLALATQMVAAARAGIMVRICPGMTVQSATPLSIDADSVRSEAGFGEVIPQPGFVWGFSP